MAVERDGRGREGVGEIREPFIPHFTHLDSTHFSGTDGYCDSEGVETIRSLIAPFSASGVHFIDSGNYHYVSRFWAEKIHQPFSLACGVAGYPRGEALYHPRGVSR
jgi:hypothetical protein